MRRGTTGTDIPRAATDDSKGGILREAGEGGFLLGRPRDFAPEGSQTPHRGFKILILQLQKMWRLDISRQIIGRQPNNKPVINLLQVYYWPGLLLATYSTCNRPIIFIFASAQIFFLAGRFGQKLGTP